MPIITLSGARGSAAAASSVLYALSPYYSAMETVLPGWSSDIGWPDEPDTSGGTEQVNTSAELITAVGLGNRRVEITENITLSAAADVADDTLIVCPNDVTVSGGPLQRTNSMGPNRVWFQGGNYIPSAVMQFRRPRDLLFLDFYAETEIDIRYQSGQSTGAQRVALIESTIDGRPLLVGAMIVAQELLGQNRHSDFILAGCKLFGLSTGNYAARIQSTEKIIQVEYANQMEAGSGNRSIRYTDCEFIVTGGRAGKLAYGGGNFHLNYLGDSNEHPYACSSAIFVGIHNYQTTGAMCVNNAANDGTVEDIEVFSSGSGVGSQPTSISPLTDLGGITDVAAWDGSTYPDISAYGAQR